MKIYSILLFITITIYQSLDGQNKSDQNLQLKDFKFESIFGTIDSDPENMYCLLGSGFFRSKRSEDSDSLINNWLKNNPDAIVIPVSSFGPVQTSKPNSKMTYCWIVNQKDTLNNYLIKMGCFPGGTMMTSNETKRIIKKKSYITFIGQIKAAEIIARNNELGVWLVED